jgi:hypothetical protein
LAECDISIGMAAYGQYRIVIAQGATRGVGDAMHFF